MRDPSPRRDTARPTKGEETRAAVLGHGLALASEAGLEGVTIGTLAERAAMSKSGLFAHFASKEALQVAILDHAVERFVAMVVVPALKERRGEPRVRALLRRWLDWSRADFMPGGCVFVASIAELDDRPGPVRDRLAASQRDWLDTLTTAIRIGVDERHFAADTDPRQVAWEILAQTYGAHLLTRLLRDRGADARLTAALDRILHGIRR
ncbi:MAG: TetR/AcrR family transcriptional regulator [Polyangiales bacterium]